MAPGTRAEWTRRGSDYVNSKKVIRPGGPAHDRDGLKQGGLELLLVWEGREDLTHHLPRYVLHAQ